MKCEGDVYHIVSRGNGRQIIFEDDEDRRFFIRTLHDYWDEAHLELYAWCLMENHFHLLVHGNTEDISIGMKKLCSVYARRFNKRTGRVGHLFQDRYDSEPIDSEAYLLSVIRYIHKNPEKGGIAPMSTYGWSSYQEYLGRPTICKTDFALDVFGGREQFLLFHEERRMEERAGCVRIIEGGSSVEDDRRKQAEEILGDIRLADLKTLPRSNRNKHLRLLKETGLSIREIERYTGIGRNIISRAQ